MTVSPLPWRRRQRIGRVFPLPSRRRQCQDGDRKAVSALANQPLKTPLLIHLSISQFKRVLDSAGAAADRPRAQNGELGEEGLGPSKSLPLPRVSTAFVAKALPLSCISTAFMTRTLPLHCVSIGFARTFAAGFHFFRACLCFVYSHCLCGADITFALPFHRD